MDDILSNILKDCPNKVEIISSFEKFDRKNDFFAALKKYYNEFILEKQRLITHYHQCMQEKFTVENEQNRLKDKLADNEKLINQQQSTIEKLENDLNDKTTKISDIEKEYEAKLNNSTSSLQRECESLKSTNSLLMSEKNELLAIINRKDLHIQQLDEQWKENVEKLRKANATKSELQAKLDEFTQNGTLNEWRKKLVTHQSEMFENQVKQHLETISNQSNEIIKLKRQNSELSVKFQTLEDQKNLEITHLNDSIIALKQHLEKVQENYKKLIDKASHNESLLNMEKMELEKELNSSNRLRDLLNEEKNDLSNTINKHREIQNELINRVHELEKENSNLMTSINDSSKLWNDNVDMYESKIKSLQDELSVAQTLLDSSKIGDTLSASNHEKNTSTLESSNYNRSLSLNNDSVLNKFLSPLAQSTAQLLKKGFTITQIYTEYSKSLDKIQDLKNEILKLSALYEDAVKQTELLKNEKSILTEEKNRSELYAEHLSKNMIETSSMISMMEEKICKLESDNAQLVEQKLSLTQLTQDLSSQIRHLLLPGESDTALPNISFSTNIEEFGNLETEYVDNAINSSLIFNTVEQLQNQNMKLLLLCRNLKTKVDQLTADPKTVSEYENRLNEANNQIKTLSDKVLHMTRTYETTKKQLDILMVATNDQNTGHDNVHLDGIKSDIGAAVSKLNNSGSFEIFRQQYQELLNNKVELLNEARLEVCRLNDKTCFLQSQISQLESQLKVSEEKCSNLESSLQHSNKEYRLKEEKLIQLDLLNKQLKESVASFKNNQDEMTEKINNLEHMHLTLSNENVHLRETSKYLESQLEAQNSQTNNFGQLLSCIQDIQNSLEYKENSSNIKMLNFIDELKEEVKCLRFQLKEAQENNDTRYHIDIQKLRQELREKDDTISRMLSVKQELLIEESRAGVSSTSSIVPNTSSIQKPNEPNGTENVIQLQEQLDSYKKQVEQLLVVSAAAEENLEKNVSLWNTCKINLDNEIHELKSCISNKNNQIEQLNSKIISLENQIVDKDTQISQFDKQQNIKVEPLLLEIEALKQREQSWNENREHLNNLLKQLRDKYEMELIGHADDITSLKDMTKKYEDMVKKSYHCESEIKRLKCKLDSLQSEYKSRVDAYELENSDKIVQQKSIIEQNNILSNQVELLMKQITSLKESAVPVPRLLSSFTSLNDNNDIKESSNYLGDDGTKSIEELWELIKYLRRDKEILETRLESQKSECFKYKIKCERLEQGCHDLEASLVAERSILNDTSSMIDQTMKLKDLELLNSQLKQQVNELESKCESLEEKLNIVKCESKALNDQLSKKNLQSETAACEVDHLKQQLMYAEKHCDELKSQVASFSKSNNELSEKLKSLQIKQSTDKSKADMFNERISNLSAEISNYKNKLNEAVADKERMLNENTERITLLTNENKLLSSKIVSLENELKKSIAQCDTLHTIASMYKDGVKATKSTQSAHSNTCDPLPSIHPPQTATTSDELIIINKHLHESKTKNTLLEEEVKRLKLKLQQIQETKKYSETASVTSVQQLNAQQHLELVNKYKKLSFDYSNLEKKFDLLTKHISEKSRKNENIPNKVVSSENTDHSSASTTNDDVTSSSKPPIINPIPIHDRISDTPLVMGDVIQSKQAYSRIVPPLDVPSINDNIITEASDCTQNNVVNSSVLPQPDMNSNVSVSSCISSQLADNSQNLFAKCVNNSSTPIPSSAVNLTNESSLPSIFSEIKPPDDVEDVKPPTVNTKRKALKSALRKISPTKGVSTSNIQPLGKKLLNRALVRRKTIAVSPSSQHVNVSVELVNSKLPSTDDTLASTHNNSHQSQVINNPIQQIKTIEDDQKIDSNNAATNPNDRISSQYQSIDDTLFKRPQKRSLTSTNDPSLTNIFIDEFETKKSYVESPSVNNVSENLSNTIDTDVNSNSTNTDATSEPFKPFFDTTLKSEEVDNVGSTLINNSKLEPITPVGTSNTTNSTNNTVPLIKLRRSPFVSENTPNIGPIDSITSDHQSASDINTNLLNLTGTKNSSLDTDDNNTDDGKESTSSGQVVDEEEDNTN